MTDTHSSAGPERSGSLLERLDSEFSDIELRPLEGQRFLESHAVFEARSNQRRRILAWFRDRIPSLVARRSSFGALSVGCGAGPLDIPIAKWIAECTDKLVYAGVNPNGVECEEFAKAFANQRIGDAELEITATTFEEFDATRSFELVHFVHSLYYMDDAAEALERARRMVAPGGHLVVIHAPEEELNDLASRFYARLYGRQSLFAADVRDTLDRSGCKYEQARIEAEIDVTAFFNGDAEIGLALRDFILQVESDELPRQVQEVVERHLRSIASERDGRWAIPHPVEVFVVEG
ncbi:MAG: methyltransferase domain-containing protein [Planctomycetota bacterium]